VLNFLLSEEARGGDRVADEVIRQNDTVFMFWTTPEER
jgi:hypothetical protein